LLRKRETGLLNECNTANAEYSRECAA
jgi:hypothetical protein